MNGSDQARQSLQKQIGVNAVNGVKNHQGSESQNDSFGDAHVAAKKHFSPPDQNMWLANVFLAVMTTGVEVGLRERKFGVPQPGQR